MLLTALARYSDSVFIDLLTNSDLVSVAEITCWKKDTTLRFDRLSSPEQEMLKARKTGQPLVNSSFSSNPKKCVNLLLFVRRKQCIVDRTQLFVCWTTVK